MPLFSRKPVAHASAKAQIAQPTSTTSSVRTKLGGISLLYDPGHDISHTRTVELTVEAFPAGHSRNRSDLVVPYGRVGKPACGSCARNGL